ncbi:MAG: dihydrofolate reductase [Bacteroidetes bacterium 43-93]|nr:dihydrofolate reductase [Bacteroidota bacterium]OJX00397.1 MAG: dihydrofolate reductase [Bacteroidetes bacterium 43-93]
MSERKIILFIACSLDGYIAKEDGDISWLDVVGTPGEDYGYSKIVEQTDTFILGRKTYDKVLTFGGTFPHDDRQTYVITRNGRPSVDNLHFYSAGIDKLVHELRAKPGKDIHLDGGGELIAAFMQQNLVDEYIISIIPVLLGQGIRLFKTGDKPEMPLKLLSSTAYPSGLVQLHYKKV